MFYLVEITKYNNGTADAYAVYAYDTRDDALASFFGKMRGAIVNPSYASELCMVVDSFGAIHRSEFWKREINVSE